MLICSYILSAMFTFINNVQREKDQISRDTQRYIGLKVHLLTKDICLNSPAEVTDIRRIIVTKPVTIEI